MTNCQNCKYLLISYKCSYDSDKINLEEIDAYIVKPYNITDLHCEDEYTKKKLIKMVYLIYKDRKLSKLNMLITLLNIFNNIYLWFISYHTPRYSYQTLRA